jgi:DNA-binding GntR family transcriptional regulator
MAAEIAADRASDDDLTSLVEIDARADLATPGGARRAVGRFQLEIAAVSQSPRLVHEELRLQAEAGPLLWLCLREQDSRNRSRRARLDVIQAIRDVRPEDARRATTEHVASAVEWLIDEKVRLEASAFPEPVTDKEGARP